MRRRKAHEHSLDQTLGQIATLEQQINHIESANINRETLLAMEKAGDAMKQIHGKLTPEKVDETMYVVISPLTKPLEPHAVQEWGNIVCTETDCCAFALYHREKLREQNALSEEIVTAITSNTIGEAVDEEDLEAELEELAQAQLEDKMLQSGSVPVSDAVHRLPAAANGESELTFPFPLVPGSHWIPT